NVSIGTIFAIYKRKDPKELLRSDFLRPGREQIAAGYIIYGSSTVLVYTDGSSVDGFTLDPAAGEYFLSRPNLRMPTRTKVLSTNECNEPYWPNWMKPYIESVKARNDADKRRVTSRHIGSLVADYPLQVTPPGDRRIMNTVDFLMRNCFQQGGFFQDMIHSGINPYLTLCIAQTLLRAGDMRCIDLIHTVADLASPTGHWPEAIHPSTLGGCMGDGQHGWAASEWVMALRSLFVREEGDGLILGSGLDPAWLQAKEPLEFGPALTPFGQINVYVIGTGKGRAKIRVSGTVNPEQTSIKAALPGYLPQHIQNMDQEYQLAKI
ncbi:MAG: hypothetical protein ACLFQG_09975, partial [Desulfovermiculus sp.]